MKESVGPSYLIDKQIENSLWYATSFFLQFSSEEC